MHSITRSVALALSFSSLFACAADTEVEIGDTRASLASTADIGTALRALPGVGSVTEAGGLGGGGSSFTFTVEEPIDHALPAAGTFKLRVQLKHRSETAPTVLSSTGYSLFSPSPSDSEPSTLLSANSVTVEQRFFSGSTPMADAGGEPPADAWKYMTVKQAADDTHHVIELLKQIYTGPWISTGASKGGQVSVYHYRFHPEDLVGVVAYVAPHSYGSDDQRYVRFLEHVGDASCRDKIVALQHAVLMRRSETYPLFQQRASSMGLTFTAVEEEAAFEHIVQEFRFAFWQYGTPAACNSVPGPDASANTLLSAITDQVPLNLGADENIRSVRQFETYYYQAAVELGQYGPLEQHLEDVILHKGTYTMEKYAPQVPSLKFVPETMIDIGDWVKNEAQHMIFVYGQNDPWTAGAFELNPAHDIHGFVVPNGNHGASLNDRGLPAESRELALQILERWTGATPRPLTDEEMEAQANGQQLFFHLPQQHLRL